MRTALLPAGQEKVKEAPKLLCYSSINNLSEQQGTSKTQVFVSCFFFLSQNPGAITVNWRLLSSASWPSDIQREFAHLYQSSDILKSRCTSLLPKEQARINSICNLKRKISLSLQFKHRKKILDSALLTVVGKRTVSISLSPLCYFILGWVRQICIYPGAKQSRIRG